MIAEWTVRFYGDWRSFLTVVRAGAGGNYDDPRCKKWMDDLLESRSGSGGDEEDEPCQAHIVVTNAEELADLLAILRSDKSGDYGWGVGYHAKTTEADVWLGLPGVGYYGKMIAANEIRVDAARLAKKLRDAMRSASSILDAALQPETPSAEAGK